MVANRIVEMCVSRCEQKAKNGGPPADRRRAHGRRATNENKSAAELQEPDQQVWSADAEVEGSPLNRERKGAKVFVRSCACASLSQTYTE